MSAMVDVVPDQMPPLKLLQGLGLLTGLAPVDGRKLEDAIHLPGGQEGKEITQVGERLDIVHAAGRDERDDDRVPFSTAIGGAEEPVLRSDLLVPQLELGGVIVEAKGAVIEEAGETPTGAGCSPWPPRWARRD
jgi:hypothetical protein